MMYKSTCLLWVACFGFLFIEMQCFRMIPSSNRMLAPLMLTPEEREQLLQTSTTTCPTSSAHSGMKKIRSALTAALIASTTMDSISYAATSPAVTTQVLEEKISQLESAETRETVLQGLADVFEAAESKTLLVRTRYKYRIVRAINEKHVKLGNSWDQALGYASGELKRRADPFRTVDLSGYLQVAPFIGGAGYLGALFVQQTLPELFVFAYPLAVFVFAAPIAFIVLAT